MKKQEKEYLQKLYTERYSVYVNFDEEVQVSAEIELKLLDRMIINLLGYEEKRKIKNNAIMEIDYNNSNYVKSMFDSVESWLRQIEKQFGDKYNNFTYTSKGLRQVECYYYYLKGEEYYDGFFNAITLAKQSIENK